MNHTPKRARSSRKKKPNSKIGKFQSIPATEKIAKEIVKAIFKVAEIILLTKGIIDLFTH